MRITQKPQLLNSNFQQLPLPSPLEWCN